MPRERAEFWIDLISRYHTSVGLTGPLSVDFGGTLVRAKTGLYQLVGWRSSTITYHRTPRQICGDPDDDYRLIIPLTGRVAVRQDDQQERLLPGSAALITMSQPFQIWQSSAQGLAMTIPRHQFASRLDRSVPQALRIDLSSGLGRVIGDLASGLFAERDALTPQHFNAVSDRMTELLCLLAVGDRQPKDEPVLAALADTIRQYVQAHAEDPELSGQSIASALGWSLRQVQRALQCVQTTPRDLIREERLRLGRERLRDPAHRQVSIAELAAQLGFSSASAFSTALRREFGVRPREARRG